MRKNNLFLAFIICLVLVFTAFLYVSKRSDTWKHSGASGSGRVLPDFDPDSVARISLSDGTGKLNIKKEKGRWVVCEASSYPADFAVLSQFICDLHDLKAVQNIPAASPAALRELGLVLPRPDASPATVKLDVYDTGGSKLFSMLFGKKHMKKTFTPDGSTKPEPDGSYIMVENGRYRPLLVSGLFEEARPLPLFWLSREFVTPEYLSFLALENGKGDTLWKLARPRAEDKFRFSSGSKAEIPEYLVDRRLKDLILPRFINVCKKDMMPELRGETPVYVLHIRSFDGFSHVLRYFRRDGKYFISLSLDNSNAAAKKSGKYLREKFYSGWIYEIPESSCDALKDFRSNLLRDFPASGRKG